MQLPHPSLQPEQWVAQGQRSPCVEHKLGEELGASWHVHAHQRVITLDILDNGWRNVLGRLICLASNNNCAFRVFKDVINPAPCLRRDDAAEGARRRRAGRFWVERLVTGFVSTAQNGKE